ncbi:tripartite motif-containing protein 59 isoform X1 [Sylvia atricapilla]|uniref:tripartite motif-containing protein 59 isoform X1 n=2 Tax=Sylvia atricapilla TaxID=48155 RepID=UPI003393909A
MKLDFGISTFFFVWDKAMERLEEELSCAICCEIFSEPRVLPCSHTFCRPCLQGLLRSPRQLLSCPSCRAPLAVPSAGPEALPVNFAIQAVIDKCRQEAAAAPEAGTCPAHPRQPLNVYCLQDRRLVCGQCLTVGKHRGHPIDDLQSAYRKGREASGSLLRELGERSRSGLCSERLRQEKARCRDAVHSDREAVLRYFKELGDALERQKEDLLRALDELDGSISEKYDPLIEEVEKVKLEESELKELYSALQEEESPLLFLEKLDALKLRLQALRQKQLPEPEPLEIHPRMENVLQDTWSKTELGLVHRIHTPKLQLVPKSQGFGEVSALFCTVVTEIQAALTDPNVLLAILMALLALSLKDLLAGAIPAPLVQLWKFLQWISPDCCTELQDRVQELCYTSVLPLRLCRTIFPDYFD